MKLLLFALSALVFGLHSVHAADFTPFVGTWEVDVERTQEEAKKSPKYKPEDAAVVSAMLKRMAESVRVRFAETEVTFIQGAKEQKLPVTLKSGDATSAVLAGKMGEKDVVLTLRLIEGKFLNMKSSATDDTDYFVWKLRPVNR